MAHELNIPELKKIILMLLTAFRDKNETKEIFEKTKEIVVNYKAAAKAELLTTEIKDALQTLQELTTPSKDKPYPSKQEIEKYIGELQREI